MQISATLNVSEIVPSRKSIATIKLPDFNFGKVLRFTILWTVHGSMLIDHEIFKTFFFQPEVQYFHEHATFTTAVALHQLPAVDITCTIGNRTIAIAAEGVMRLRQEALPNTMPAFVWQI